MSDDDAAPAPRKKKPRRSTGDMVVVLRTDDPLRARMIAEVLEEEGITVATPGLEQRSILGGIYGGHIDISLRVHEDDAERAAELVREIDEAEPADEIDDAPGGYRGAARRRTEDAPPAAEVRLARIAVFCACVVPGGGQFYVRRYAAGFTLLAMQLTVWFAVAHDVPLAFLFFPVVFAADVFMASRIAFISQGRARPETAPGLGAAAMVAIAVLGGLSFLAGPGARAIAGPGDTGLCDFAARCRDGMHDTATCVRNVAADRLSGIPAVYGDACGSCLLGLACDDQPECDDACAREWGGR